MTKTSIKKVAKKKAKKSEAAASKPAPKARQIIVAPNRQKTFADRPWMIRKVGTDKIEEVKSVAVKNGRMRSVYSDNYQMEANLGCGYVLVGEEAEEIPLDDRFHKISGVGFSGSLFFVGDHENTITTPYALFTQDLGGHVLFADPLAV